MCEMHGLQVSGRKRSTEFKSTTLTEISGVLITDPHTRRVIDLAGSIGKMHRTAGRSAYLGEFRKLGRRIWLGWILSVF